MISLPTLLVSLAVTSASPEADTAAQKLETAKALAREGKLEAAEKAARTAILQDPRLFEAQLLVGSLCSMDGRLDCAEKAYLDGLKHSPTCGPLEHALGMLELERSKYKEAVKHLEAAHRLEARDLEYAADLAYAYLFVDRAKDAATLAKKLRRRKPAAFAPAFTHGEALLRLGSYEEAVEAYGTALKLDSTAAVAKHRMAIALEKSGASEKALAYYEELRAGPMKANPIVHAQTAALALRLGKQEQALLAARAAKGLAPNNAQIANLLDQVRSEKKEQDDGRK